MRLRLIVLLAWLTIYCNCLVLSSAPSLIVKAASFTQQLPYTSKQANTATSSNSNALWRKDTQFLPDTERASDGLKDIKRFSRNNAASASAAKVAQQLGLDLNRKLAAEYDLNTLLGAPDETAISQSAELLPQENEPRIRAVQLSEFYSPLKYWARYCQTDNNCPQEYYRALLADSNKAAALKEMEAIGEPVINADKDYLDESITDGDSDDYASNDVFMLLTGEQDLIKFLYWAMEQLYPYQKFANLSDNDADYYHPGMYIWKKLNLSGRLEPPLIVEEPHYIIVRRQKLEEDLQPGSNFKNDPFIPPRGRKHDFPDLNALMRRYETFVPNRGKRDKIKDIFKYDDLFFPNRGKRLKTPIALTSKKLYNDSNQRRRSTTAAIVNSHFADDMEKADLLSRVLREMQRKLQQQERCMEHATNNKNSEATNLLNPNNIEAWPQGMSIHKTNGYNQSTQSSVPEMTAATRKDKSITPTKNALQQQWITGYMNARLRRVAGSFAALGAARVAANRLHSAKSMSNVAQQQQHRQQQYRRPLPVEASWRQRREQQRQQQTAGNRQHQVKSFNNLDPLLWRQLRLLQQKALTLRHSTPMQHNTQPLAFRFSDDDANYSNLNI